MVSILETARNCIPKHFKFIAARLEVLNLDSAVLKSFLNWLLICRRRLEITQLSRRHGSGMQPLAPLRMSLWEALNVSSPRRPAFFTGMHSY